MGLEESVLFALEATNMNARSSLGAKGDSFNTYA